MNGPQAGGPAPLEELKRLLPQCLLVDQLHLGSRLALLLRGNPRASGGDREVRQLLERARR